MLCEYRAFLAENIKHSASFYFSLIGLAVIEMTINQSINPNM